MRSIQLLDQSTVNKIAAGEVVERPSSVVKELVENAIDAKSSAVTIEIKDGGTSYIRITDNGIGIPKEQVNTAFLRHSTSKIKDVYDLNEIGTLGFRGEALASIAAVSRVEIMTKTRDDLTGIRIVIEGGKVLQEEEIGCPEGTTIIIRNLFYNTPARRKFLKRPATEGSYISDLVNRIALGHPEVSFKYLNKGKVLLHTSGNNDLKNSIFGVYGKNLVKDMIELKTPTPKEVEEEHSISIKGFLGKPVLCRGNKTYESYYINGRYIKSKIIEKALHDAYKDFIPPNNYPVVVLHLTIDPKTVDVNVHPTKMEVRFENEEEIYQLVYKPIYEHLIEDNLIPEIKLAKEKAVNPPLVKEDIPEPFELKNQNLIEEKAKLEKQPISINKDNEVSQDKRINQDNKIIDHGRINENNKSLNENNKKIDEDNRTMEDNRVKQHKGIKETNQANEESIISQNDNKINNETEKTVINPSIIKDETIVDNKTVMKEGQLDIGLNKLKETLSDFKIIGQIFNTYWIIEKENKMYMVDQHAAHEKVLYERIKKSRNDDNNSQILINPIVLNLMENEDLIMNKSLRLFKEFGFEIEEFGNRSYIVRGLPYIFNQTADEKLLISMLDGLLEEEKKITDDLLADKIALMSCKAAVKGNNRMSVSEIKSLMEQLFTLDNPYNCPHGRPTIISMSKYELEKKFKRV